MESDSRSEQEEIDAAAAEAAQIGGIAGDEDLDPADRPLIEAGEGEAEGFELAEDDLIEHASHGDSHGTSRAYSDRDTRDDEGTAIYGETDNEMVSEIDEDADDTNVADDASR